jgi:hypothetical protein
MKSPPIVMAHNDSGGTKARGSHAFVRRVFSSHQVQGSPTTTTPLSSSAHLGPSKYKNMQANSRPTSSRPAASPAPPKPHQVNTQTTVLDTHHGRLLCIADIRGKLSSLNDLAREADAKAIIHTGDFGFFGASARFSS